MKILFALVFLLPPITMGAASAVIYQNNFDTSSQATPFLNGVDYRYETIQLFQYDETNQALRGVDGKSGFAVDLSLHNPIDEPEGIFTIDFVFGNRNDSTAFISFADENGNRFLTFGNSSNNGRLSSVGPQFNRFATDVIDIYEEDTPSFFSIRIIYNTATSDGELFLAPILSFTPGAVNFDEDSLVLIETFQYSPDSLISPAQIAGIGLTSQGPGSAETLFDDIRITFQNLPDPPETVQILDVTREAGDMIITWTSEIGTLYSLEYSRNLVTWYSIGKIFIGTEKTKSAHLPFLGNKIFLRVGAPYKCNLRKNLNIFY